MLRLFFYFILFHVLSCTPLYADAALALHGTPKYSANAKFDYVNPNAPKGGEMRLAIIGSFDHTSPYPIKSAAAEGIFLVYDSLLKRSLDEPFSCYGRIATNIDLDPQESKVTFSLDARAKFHNGQPILAQDVMATFNTLKEKGPFTLKQAFSKIKQVTSKDPHNISFEFKTPGQRQLALMIGFMPILSHKELNLQHHKDSLQNYSLTGSGPYKIGKTQAGKSIEYLRVADYWARDLTTNLGHNNFDQIKYEYFRNYESAFQAFKAGEIDLFQEDDIGNWLKNYNFTAVQRGDVQLKEIPHPFAGMSGFVFNTRNAFLATREVRQALSLIQDLDWVNKKYFHNAYEPMRSYFQNTDFEAPENPSEEELALLGNKNFSDYTLSAPQADDPRSQRHQAVDLLTKSGYRFKNNKLYHATTNKPVSLEILIQAAPHERIALAYKKNLESLGIQTSVRMVDSAQYEARLTHFDFDIIFHQWDQIQAPSEEQIKYWGSEAATTKGTKNYAGIKDPQIDSLIDKIILERTTEKLIPQVRLLDRLLRLGYYVSPFLMKRRDTLAYWNKFEQPKIQPISAFPLVKYWVVQTWWKH